MQQEQPAQHRQSISVVNGNAFITTELIRTDVDGNEFVTYRNVQPYPGTLDQLKEETEAVKLAEESRHESVISDAEAKIAEINKAINEKKDKAPVK